MRRVDPGNPTSVAPQKGTYVIRTVAKGQRLPTPVRPTGTRLQVVQPQAIRQEAAPEVINIDDEDEPECVTEKTVNASTIQHRIVPTVGPGATGTPGTKLVRVSEHGGRVFIAHVQPQNQPRFIRRPIGGVRYYTAGTVRAVEPRRFLQPDELRLKDSPIGGYDPEFQRIEASLRRAETEKRKELESQRLSCLTSYQSRGTELPEQARKLVQQLFNAPSNLNLSPNDDQEAKVIKNILNDVVTKVCNMDKENGWHREILRKARPVDILNAAPKTGVQVKRPNFRAVEALVTEKMEVLRKHIAKKRAKFELDVEFENHFIKRTRSGAVSCVPYAQTYARIGAPWPVEPDLAETPSTVASAPISADTKVLKTPKLELKHDSGYAMETDEPTSEFSTSPLRSSGRQPIKARRLSPGVETSPTRSMIQSVCPSGVSIISSVDLKEMRKSKPGRPSNKDKKKMERQIAMQRKKLIKSGISQEGAIEFDINACHCICRQPYDPKKFYLACNRCKCWFHGKCVNITEKKAKRLPEWMCAECAPGGYSGMKKKKKTKQEVQFADEEDVDDNQLFCICRQTYDHSRNYIGCDGCNDWFHFECVGVTEEMSKRIKKYTCPLCEKKPSQLSRDEFAAMCAAVEAMAEDEQSLLFSSEAPEGQEFRETVPLQLFLNEICERVQSLHYKNFQEFVNEVATLQSAVMEHCGQESALPAAIQYLTNKASTTLLEHLPNHPALTG